MAVQHAQVMRQYAAIQLLDAVVFVRAYGWAKRPAWHVRMEVRGPADTITMIERDDREAISRAPDGVEVRAVHWPHDDVRIGRQFLRARGQFADVLDEMETLHTARVEAKGNDRGDTFVLPMGAWFCVQRQGRVAWIRVLPASHKGRVLLVLEAADDVVLQTGPSDAEAAMSRDFADRAGIRWVRAVAAPAHERDPLAAYERGGLEPGQPRPSFMPARERRYSSAGGSAALAYWPEDDPRVQASREEDKAELVVADPGGRD
jgi:hypothetical protein